MNVKEAVFRAKTYVGELFEDESPRNLGLEEVELDHATNEWIVTVGFSRPWDEPKGALAALANSPLTRRVYKVVRISNGSEEIISVKNRDLQP
jgi:hypothetical protein